MKITQFSYLCVIFHIVFNCDNVKAFGRRDAAKIEVKNKCLNPPRTARRVETFIQECQEEVKTKLINEAFQILREEVHKEHPPLSAHDNTVQYIEEHVASAGSDPLHKYSEYHTTKSPQHVSYEEYTTYYTTKPPPRDSYEAHNSGNHYQQPHSSHETHNSADNYQQHLSYETYNSDDKYQQHSSQNSADKYQQHSSQNSADKYHQQSSYQPNNSEDKYQQEHSSYENALNTADKYQHYTNVDYAGSSDTDAKEHQHQHHRVARLMHRIRRVGDISNGIYSPTLVPFEDKRIAGCLLHCVYAKNNAIDKLGWPTLDGLVDFYSEGVNEHGFFMATLRSVNLCLRAVTNKYHVDRRKQPEGGESCDLAFDVFDCISDQITGYCLDQYKH